MNAIRKHKTIIFIILACICTAAAQGNQAIFHSSHQSKVLALLVLYFIYFGCFYFYRRTAGLRSEENDIFFMIALGVLIRCSYVLLSGLYQRQHDAGAYTGMGTEHVNAGHIGYIEYIYKFGKLPDVNPYELFAYYHPPLHHIISFLWLKLNLILGVTEELAFENLQIMTLLYSNLCMIVTYKILKLLKVTGTGLYVGMAFIVFHPATIYMSGSVNNDMLTMLLMCLTLYAGLKWIRQKNLKNLLIIGLCLAFGMVTKLNSAVMAFPLALIFLMHFIGIIRSKVKADIILWIKNYVLFGFLTGGIGLSWIVRNLIRFGEKPGVPVPGVTSPMYTEPYSLWERLGIPALADWKFHFPFHPISAKACNNTWVIMFQTSLFAEEYPVDLPDILLSLCQITYTLAVVLGIVTAVLLIYLMCRNLFKKPTATSGEMAGEEAYAKEDALFLLSGYVIMLVSFAAFVIIYPYTCSSDFRYVIICLVYIAIGLAYGSRYLIDDIKKLPALTIKARIGSYVMHGINFGIIAILVSATIICMFWGQW